MNAEVAQLGDWLDASFGLDGLISEVGRVEVAHGINPKVTWRLLAVGKGTCLSPV